MTRLQAFYCSFILSNRLVARLITCSHKWKYYKKIQGTRFFISNIFISNTRLKLAKNKAKAKQHPEAELLLSENQSLCLSTLSSKNNRRYSKKIFKNNCVCYNRIIYLIMQKIRLKMRNRSHIHDANIPRPRHGHRYTNYKMSHCTMTVICIKQHISNI